MNRVINFKFKADFKGSPVSELNGKTILLDKHSAITPKVKIGESWDCQFLFERDTFAVFKPIRKTAEASGEEKEQVKQQKVSAEEFYKEEYEPSKYQKDIYNEIQHGTSNLMVNAVAGSGKTSTLLGALRRVPKTKTIKFLAFNRSIVEELRKKVPKTLVNVDISTVHGFGMKALNMKFKCEVKADKYREIAKTISVDWDIPDGVDKEDYIRRVVKLCDLGRLNLCKYKSELEDLSVKHDIELTNGECGYAIELIRIGLRDTKHVDYTDMIYFPNIMNLTVKQYDLVFIDEAQDLNACQRELMLKAVKPDGGRFCAVGDPKQAIYGFAGADVESFKKLAAQNNTKSLPLSVCYRCDTAMIEKAKTIVPQIEARDGAPEGIVDNNASVKDIRDGDMILCRNTFPLVRLCISYLANGIKAYIMGRDIGANLINMVRNTRETFVVGVFKKLNRELKKIESNICTKRDMIPREARETMTYQSFKEKIDVIETLSKGLDKASEVIDKIDKIFSDDDSEGIILSTIHKAKGLEKDKVFIIHEDLMPSKWCLEIDWMLEQEYNLMYVAYTRAKHYLGFVQDYDAYGSKDIDLVDKGKIKDDWNNKDKD